MKYQFYAFDTDCIVHLAEEHDEKKLQALFSEIQSWHTTFNVFDEASEVSQFNQAEAHFKASNHFYRVTQEMMYYRDMTNGSFEPFVEYIEDKERQGALIVQADKMTYTKMHTDGHLIFDAENMIRKSHPEIKINFHSFLKGYACDYMREIMYEEMQLRHFLIDLGGNVLAEGMSSEGEYWKVGIQNPGKDRGEAIHVLDLLNESLVTTGNYERPFYQNGARLSHIINANTGGHEAYRDYSISVKCASATVGEVLTTALFQSVNAGEYVFLKTFNAQAIKIKDGEIQYYS